MNTFESTGMGKMRHGNRGISSRHGVAALLALTALVAAPFAVPVPAAATASPSSYSAGTRLVAATPGPATEVPAEASFRTSVTLAGVFVGTAALVATWWFLVVRNRRRD